MRGLAAAVGVVAVVLLGVVAFALLNLRALVGAHQDRLVARVERVIGRPLTVGAIVPSWWPLGIRLRQVTIAEDPAFGTEPFIAAEGIVMGIRAWPLVHGRIEAAGVTLEAPRLRLLRDVDGRWNVESLGASPVDARASGKEKERRTAFRVPFQWVIGVALSEMRDGTVTLEDRRLGASAPVVFRHVTLRATDVRLGATARMRVDAALFGDRPDVRLDVRAEALGETDLAHAPFTARLELRNVDLAALAERLGRPRIAAGRVEQMTIDAGGTLERLRATVALELTDPGVRVGALPVGALQPITLHVEGTREHDAVAIAAARATVGKLTLEATGDATLDPGRVTLAITSEGDGHASVALDHRSFALGHVEGKISAERGGISFAPLALDVDDVPVSLRGGITGIDPPAVDVRIEARPFGGTLAADVAVDAAGAARARVEAAAIDLAAASLRLAPELAGTIEGRASGAAEMSGRVAAGTVAPGSLTGSGSLAVVDGRLRGVNLPDLVVDEVESLPFMPRLVSNETRGRYAELFGSRDTLVESATVPFAVERGRLTTKHAVLVNPAYQIVGEGWIDEAHAVRFRGTVLLGASVSRTLRDDVRAAKYLATDDGRVALPFVTRGRLGALRVEPDGRRLRARGLEAMLGTPAEPGTPPGAEPPRKERRRDESVEERVIERLEKLLRP